MNAVIIQIALFPPKLMKWGFPFFLSDCFGAQCPFQLYLVSKHDLWCMQTLLKVVVCWPWWAKLNCIAHYLSSHDTEGIVCLKWPHSVCGCFFCVSLCLVLHLLVCMHTYVERFVFLLLLFDMLHICCVYADGFRKVMHIDTGIVKQERDGPVEFQHPYFKHGQDDLLENIKRKVSMWIHLSATQT